ncbi:hypothetical protein M9Y10_033556 [Tritrichomonas musculus]|uniref:Uncharacterized protein n=1 Tax=Tritrichomonas musculus TaxID=1915356 RepID=A0ABR2KDJ2_9EUKA
MSEDEFDNSGNDFSKGLHQPSQPYSSWCANGAQTMKSVLSGQEFYFENNVKNMENIHKITLDSQYREICPVWKPALQGTHSIFDNST